MGSALRNAWKTVREFFAKRTRRQNTTLGIAAGVIIVLAIVVASLLGRVQYGALYYSLPLEEAGRVNEALDNMNVPHKSEGAGATLNVLVPKERIMELRATLATQGVVSSSAGFNYDMFTSSGFGVTDAERRRQEINSLQEMARTQIMQMDKIEQCTVLLQIPEDTVFVLSDNNGKPTATVMLKTKGNEQLTNNEVQAIGGIVKNAVGRNIDAADISIADTQGLTYYIDSAEEIDPSDMVANRLALERQVERNMQDSIISLLTPVFGVGRVKTTAHVKLSFDDVHIEEIDFEPPIAGDDAGLIISMAELYELSRLDDTAIGVPGTDSNGVGIVEYPYGATDDQTLYSKISREINYELDETRKTIDEAKGAITELSISVIIDRNAVSENYLTEINNLIVNAIGVRADYVSVESLPFQDLSAAENEAIKWQNERDAALRAKELQKLIIICATVLILGIMFAVLLGSLFKKPKPVSEVEEEELTGVGDKDAEHEGIDVIIGEDGLPVMAVAGAEVPFAENTGDRLSDLKRLIDTDPESVAKLLHTWLTEE
ncbi:MAG: flagellar M-ring protein FliF [Oscillospiraceae bacterium]|jgi:flagellar M-ring protein FliF|nr:flagellar M-ring protein FliF [Oscillospiraceae bacterium]